MRTTHFPKNSLTGPRCSCFAEDRAGLAVLRRAAAMMSCSPSSSPRCCCIALAVAGRAYTATEPLQ